MSLDTVQSDLQNRLKMAPPLGHTVLLDFGDDGQLFLTADNQVQSSGADPETTLTLSLDTMAKIISGDQDPNMAVLLGKLKVGGKMGVALKLASYLGD